MAEPCSARPPSAEILTLGGAPPFSDLLVSIFSSFGAGLGCCRRAVSWSSIGVYHFERTKFCRVGFRGAMGGKGTRFRGAKRITSSSRPSEAHLFVGRRKRPEARFITLFISFLTAESGFAGVQYHSRPAAPDASFSPSELPGHDFRERCPDGPGPPVARRGGGAKKEN